VTDALDLAKPSGSPTWVPMGVMQRWPCSSAAVASVVQDVTSSLRGLRIMTKPPVLSNVLSDSRTRNLLLVLTIMLAAGLRLWALDARCLWYDEVVTWVHASAGGVEDVLSGVLRKELPAAPLHFLLTHFVLFLDETDFLLRFPSVAFGVLAVAATYSLGTQLFGRRIGLVAAFLLAISPFHIRYSREVRAYAQLMLLSVLSLYCLWRAISEAQAKWWFGFAAFTTLGLYTHLFALLFLLAESVFGVGVGLLAASRPQELPEAGRKAAPFVISLLAIAMLYAPMIPYLLQRWIGRSGSLPWARGCLSQLHSSSAW